MPLASSNETTVRVNTTADTTGITAVTSQLDSLTNKLNVAKQRLLESSQADNVKKSTLMSLQSSVSDYQARLDGATKKQQEGSDKADAAAASTKGLAGAVAVGTAAYSALSEILQKTLGFLGSSVDSATKYQSAVAGLASTSRGMGDDVDAATQAAQSFSKDGLMQVTQSATALRNLLSSGFSLPEAMRLMDALRDKAAFNRQSFYSFGDAVVATTEGIKNGNSVLSDAVGTTQNLSVMMKNAGVSVDEMGNIQQSATARQAILNGFVGDAAVNYGDAAKMAQMYGGQQAAAGAQVERFKQSLGGVIQLVETPLLSAFKNFIGANQGTIISFGLAGLAAVAFGGALFGVIKAIQAFSISSLIAVATNPLLLLLTAVSVLAGVVVFNAVGKLQNKLADFNKGLTAGAASTDKLKNSTGGLTKAQQDLANKLADINKQIVKNNRDFQEQLAETIKQHEDTAADLKKQQDQENADFAKSQAKQLDDFKQSQQDMTDAHQQRVNDIQKQLNQELALGKWADQNKVRSLQQELDQENAEYDKQIAEKQANYDADVADAQASHDQKLTDLQTQLNAETDLLTKHAADVASVQNVQMLDEIDKIKRTHDEQITAFNDQKDQAIKSAQDASTGVSNAYSGLMNDLNGQTAGMNNLGGSLGKAMGDAFKQAMIDSLKDMGKSLEGIAEDIGKAASSKVPLLDLLRRVSYDLYNPPKKAKGGPVSANQSYLVGDNPDGTINDTTELFIPNQSGTILPAGQTRQALGGGLGGKSVTINQTNYNYSQFDMTSSMRELGWRLQNA